MPCEDKKAIEDGACYVIRNPLSLRKLVCGGPLKVVAYITDTVAIRRILDHLGLRPKEKPPPDVRELARVPLDDEGREIGAHPS